LTSISLLQKVFKATKIQLTSESTDLFEKCSSQWRVILNNQSKKNDFYQAKVKGFV